MAGKCLSTRDERVERSLQRIFSKKKKTKNRKITLNTLRKIVTFIREGRYEGTTGG